MVAVPQSLIDTLNGLLDAEENNIFRRIGAVSPKLSQATPEVREPIGELQAMSRRHTGELSALIRSSGGTPAVRRADPLGEQHLGFLSLQFLIPKLVSEKHLILTRYENAKATIGPEHADVAAALDRIAAEQRDQLELIRGIATRVTGGRWEAGSRA